MSDQPSSAPLIDTLASKTGARGLTHFPGRLAAVRREARVTRASHRLQLNLRADNPQGLLDQLKPIVAKLEAAISAKNKLSESDRKKAPRAEKNKPADKQP